jgi:hypothetical protein
MTYSFRSTKKARPRRRARKAARADRDEETLAREAVTDQRRERGYDCRWEKPRQTRETYPERPADLVREYAERHEVRPLRRDRSAPCELDAAELLIAKDRCNTCHRRQDSFHAPIERLLCSTGKL